jgi:hypothetical protein
MKKFKLLLIILSALLISSCASFQLESGVSTIDVNHYNYDRIHYLYTSNPNYFYTNTYINQYGVRNYYYQHPYFIRYCANRNIRPYNNHYNNRLTKVIPTRRVQSRYTNTRVNTNLINRTRVNRSKRSVIPSRSRVNNSKNIKRQNSKVIRNTLVSNRRR